MHSKTTWAWTAISIWALLAHFSGGSWPALIVLAVISYAVMKLMPDNMEALYNDRWNCLIQLIGIILLLSQLLPASAQYWPGEYADKVIPAVLLVLGAYSCLKRPERTAGVLLWAMVILLIPVIIAGVRDIRLEWIEPKHYGVSLWTVPVMLIPLLVKLTGERENGIEWYAWTLLTGIGIWIMTTGVLSDTVAEQQETPFHYFSKSLSLGAYSRFESLVSTALTFGWYGFSSLMLSCASNCIRGLNIKKKIGLCACVILVLTIQLNNVTIPPEIVVIYLIFAWIIFPLFEMKKISKKSEKSA